MTILMEKGATPQNIDAVLEELGKIGLAGKVVEGDTRSLICIIGDETKVQDQIVALRNYEGVDKVTLVNNPYKIISRDSDARYGNNETLVVDVNGVKIGGEKPAIIAGPCTIFNYKQLKDTAIAVKEAGADILRGGAYKPRSSPYSFQGLGADGLRMLRLVGDEVGMPVITEVVDTRHVDIVSHYSDIVQIGARNMQNIELLKEVGRQKKPVLLKRGGLEPSLENWLCCAEYIALEGNKNIILCERGTPTNLSGEYSRNTIDLGIIREAQKRTYLPILVDPSHASGRRDMITGLSKAALAMGANALMIEVMREDEEPHIMYQENGMQSRTGFCDYKQSLKPSEFKQIMYCINKGR